MSLVPEYANIMVCSIDIARSFIILPLLAYLRIGAVMKIYIYIFSYSRHETNALELKRHRSLCAITLTERAALSECGSFRRKEWA